MYISCRRHVSHTFCVQEMYIACTFHHILHVHCMYIACGSLRDSACKAATALSRQINRDKTRQDKTRHTKSKVRQRQTTQDKTHENERERERKRERKRERQINLTVVCAGREGSKRDVECPIKECL